MNLFVYNLREFDERRCFDELAERYGFTYRSTDQIPTMETARLAEGYRMLPDEASLPMPKTGKFSVGPAKVFSAK